MPERTRLELHPDRLFPAEPTARRIARELFGAVETVPIVSPHGHCEAAWFADDLPFSDPLSLLVQRDHYLTRMLYSRGVALTALGIGARVDPRVAWRCFADHIDLFRGTPSQLWLDYTFATLFGLDVRLAPVTADHYFDTISAALAEDAFRPRRLLESFRIELLATTDSPVDDLDSHRALADQGGRGKVVPTFRPDPVVDPEYRGFAGNVETLGELTGRDVTRWSEYLAALYDRRQVFRGAGATATDHGPPTAATAALDAVRCQHLLTKALSGSITEGEAALFRAQLLTEMAGMSVSDGLVMQLHPGSRRNHNRLVYETHGADRGADIPGPTNYVDDLRPLLDRYGNDRRLTLILFTLDETTYTRELAPLAGHYPCLLLGPPWWFSDSVEGLRRYRRAVTETAGFANTAGFNDDARTLVSIPARHDMARRVDCGELARLVAEHRLTLDEAHDLALDCAHRLARRAYRLDGLGAAG